MRLHDGKDWDDDGGFSRPQEKVFLPPPGAGMAMVTRQMEHAHQQEPTGGQEADTAGMRFPEEHRHKRPKGLPLYASNPGERHGVFFVPGNKESRSLKVIASDGDLGGGKHVGWEHVSVSVHTRNSIPTWKEMCRVRDMFWGPDAWVVQYHPPRKDYVNTYPGCLHLFRYVGGEMPFPPKVLV